MARDRYNGRMLADGDYCVQCGENVETIEDQIECIFCGENIHRTCEGDHLVEEHNEQPHP